MDELERDAMQQIRVLGEEKVSEFEQLQAERNIWRQRKAAKHDKIKQLNQLISRQQTYMQSAEYQRKQHAQSLQQQTGLLQQRITDLTADLSLANDPSALKERLTAAIKRVNDEVGGMEGKRQKVVRGRSGGSDRGRAPARGRPRRHHQPHVQGDAVCGHCRARQEDVAADRRVSHAAQGRPRRPHSGCSSRLSRPCSSW